MRNLSPLMCFAVLLVTLSCQKKEEGELPVLVGEEEVVDHSLHCEENFVADWCGTNQENSLVTEICVGTLILGDQIVSAISLQEDGKSQCYVSTGEAEEIQFPGCAHASLNQYVSDLRGSTPMESVVCYSQNQPAYLEGSSPAGEAFRTFNIQ